MFTLFKAERIFKLASMVKSKFKFMVYFAYVFMLAFLIFSIYLFSHPKMHTSGTLGIRLPAPVTGLIILMLASFLFLMIAPYSQVTKITDQIISVSGFYSRKMIGNADIRSIDLFDKENPFLTARGTTLAIKIVLETGKKIILSDTVYRNSHEIRKGLYENFKEKITYPKRLKGSRASKTGIDSNFQKFAGNPYTSVNGIMVFLILGFIFILTANFFPSITPTHFLILIPLAFLIALCLFIAYQLNYFTISDQHIIVKNHFLPWVNRKYEVDEVIETNFEYPYKNSDALRITTNDFKSKLYRAGSLRKKDWQALKEKLKKLHLHFMDLA